MAWGQGYDSQTTGQRLKHTMRPLNQTHSDQKSLSCVTVTFHYSHNCGPSPPVWTWEDYQGDMGWRLGHFMTLLPTWSLFQKTVTCSGRFCIVKTHTWHGEVSDVFRGQMRRLSQRRLRNWLLLKTWGSRLCPLVCAVCVSRVGGWGRNTGLKAKGEHRQKPGRFGDDIKKGVG